jgi:hypothetical protein
MCFVALNDALRPLESHFQSFLLASWALRALDGK